MQNHTATHVLNHVLHSLLAVTCQKSSLVTPEYLKFDFAVFNVEIDSQFLKQVESRVMSMILDNLEVRREIMDTESLLKVKNLVTLPGEVYPAQVSVINVLDQSEPCCGTHLANTGDIENFVIVSCKTSSSGVKSLRALTGTAAKRAREHGVKVCEEILSLQETMEQSCEDLVLNLNQIKAQISKWKTEISDSQFPLVLAQELTDILETYQQRVKLSERSALKQEISEQMELAILEQESKPFFIKVLEITGKSKFSLQRAAKSMKKPCLILSLADGELKGKAFVPQDIASDDFHAR